MEEKNQAVQQAEIDKDVIDELVKKNALDGIKDQRQINRVMLNFMCELLSELKHLNQAIDSYNELLTVVSSDKLQDFFLNFRSNVEAAQKEDALQEKIHADHKKPGKTKKQEN